MKRAIAFLLVLVMCLSLCACGKSDAAIAAEKAIAEIGIVTLESENAIVLAENLYAVLSDKEKESLDNRIDLANARSTYDQLVEKAIAEAQAAILEAEAAAEADRIEKINAALPEAAKLLRMFDSAISDLKFVAKYAGNVNNKGSRKFADSFISGMEKNYVGVDIALIRDGIPELADSAETIIKNHQMIRDLLVEMGRTNSASNVSTIKSLALDTIAMIDSAVKVQQEFENSLTN